MKKVMSIVKENKKIAALAAGGAALVVAGGFGIRRWMRRRSEA